MLTEVSLEVGEGEILCLLGPTGAGKTSTLKVALGLLPAAEGRVWVFGKDMTRASESEWNEVRTHMGMVFQHAALFDSMTVLENVLFALRNERRADEGKARELLKRLGLSHAEGLYPAQLSGGMRKKVALARALVREPRILLCDEPTGGMDPASAAEAWDIIVGEAKAKGVATVVVTHDLDFVRAHADRVVVLHQGRVAASGDLGEVLASGHPAVEAIFRTGVREF